MNPTPGKYFLHMLHEQFSGIHFLISPLKEDENDFCFISEGTILQILGPKYEMVSKPFHTVFADGWWNWEPKKQNYTLYNKLYKSDSDNNRRTH